MWKCVRIEANEWIYNYLTGKEVTNGVGTMGFGTAADLARTRKGLIYKVSNSSQSFKLRMYLPSSW